MDGSGDVTIKEVGVNVVDGTRVKGTDPDGASEGMLLCKIVVGAGEIEGAGEVVVGEADMEGAGETVGDGGSRGANTLKNMDE